MKRSDGLLVLTMLLLPPLLAPAGGPAARAEPIVSDRTPEPLRPWVDWVLHGQEEARCPFFQGDADQRQCLWPSRLELDLGDRGGRFTQSWMTFKEAWAPLPGDARFWPQAVRIDGRPAAVTLQQELPKLLLTKGRHAVTGAFEWDALPPLLQVPAATGLLHLTLRGREVAFPRRDEQGRLWLEKPPGAEQEESRMDIAVHRRVTDDIPLLLTTRIDLQVSGESREALLGRALPDHFVPISLTGPLPARLEADKRLRVQVRPGRWTIEIVARHEGPVTSLTLPEPQGPWNPDEVWVFDARPDLRLVRVEGVQAIDPQQTTLPEEWKKLPTYVLRPGQSMKLVEKRRGDSDPPPDHLSLQREWWLDFDGEGCTVHDQVSGVMERGWRLEILPPAVLGRVAVNGGDQFITRLGKNARAGVEIRRGQVRLEADSRLPLRGSTMSAVGWDQDFQQVQGILHLSPGWRLFHVSGVDDVSATWISSWTLLDLFLVLITTMAVAKLWGWRWGALALATLTLTWIEVGAPRWVWLVVLLGEVLRRALPAGRFLRLVNVYRLVAMAALALVAIPFAIRQVRTAIYPVLEYPGDYTAPYPVGGLAAVPPPPDYERVRGLPKPEEAVEGAERLYVRAKVAEAPAPAGGTPGGTPGAVLAGAAPSKAAQVSEKMFDYRRFVSAPDPSTVVQTGPGLPAWSWRRVGLNWRGPVTRAQVLHFVLIPPRVNFVLAFLRVALLALLGICLVGLSGSGRVAAPIMQRLGLSGMPAGALSGMLALATRLALLLATLLCLASSPARADIPPSDILEELRDRLLEPPECSPDCASIPRLALEVSGARQDGGRAALAAGFSWRTPGADGRGAARTGGNPDPPAAQTASSHCACGGLESRRIARGRSGGRQPAVDAPARRRSRGRARAGARATAVLRAGRAGAATRPQVGGCHPGRSADSARRRGSPRGPSDRG
ncbi:MAG: hypothetical protein DMF49_05195 [Acidobacteria bacterium]|nr:MAG: hypothetical protein DMF49_05195 [Acidobacteriota bacterium]